VITDHEGSLIAVDERIPPPVELVELGEPVMELARPTAVERAALVILRDTSQQPTTVEGALEAATRVSEEVEAEQALRHLVAINLVRRVTSDDGREVVFNPNIWAGNSDVVTAALRVEDARVRTEVGALIEEVAANPGIPQDLIRSTEVRWIDFAVAHGLVQRSLVVTTQGVERGFLFTPHLGRDPFGVGRNDPSGHVRQLVGSMIYAATFPRYRLGNPAAFIRRLLREGEAGDASPIGTDYPMLETAGIVRVEPADRFFKFVLLQNDVAEDALHYLEERGTSDASVARGLREQRSYTHVERERARLALSVPADDAETRRLISALRETTARRRFRGR
jgi:hypothetical protein